MSEPSETMPRRGRPPKTECMSDEERAHYLIAHPRGCACAAHRTLLGPAEKQAAFWAFADDEEIAWEPPWGSEILKDYGPCRRWNGPLDAKNCWRWYDPAMNTARPARIARYVYALEHGEDAVWDTPPAWNEDEETEEQYAQTEEQYAQTREKPLVIPIVAICVRMRCCAPLHMRFSAGSSYAGALNNKGLVKWY